MANLFDGMRYDLDTASATAVTTAAIYVKSVAWEGTGMTAGTTALLIKDPVSSLPLVSSLATGTTVVEYRDIEDWWPRGFTLLTLGAGKVQVQLGTPRRC